MAETATTMTQPWRTGKPPASKQEIYCNLKMARNSVISITEAVVANHYAGVQPWCGLSRRAQQLLFLVNGVR